VQGPPPATQRLSTVADDYSLEEVNVNWYTGPGTGMGMGMMTSDIMFLENGDMIAGQFGTGIVQYSRDGSYKRTYGDPQVEAFTVSGNKIFIIDSKTNSILVYDGETYDQTTSLSFDGLTMDTNIATGQNGAVYIYNSTGVFRLLPAGTIFEKIIEGDMTSLSMPNNNFQSFTETKEGTFLLFSRAQAESKIYRYTYDPDIAARPENELVVFTLYENRTLRQTAGVFQKEHPDTRVNIQVGMGEDGAVVSDIVKTLNTEIMANKGPDIIMLDGLSAANYIDKGVLLDIADIVKEVSDQEKMIGGVLRSFEKNGKIYAVPAKFSMPVIFVDAGDAAYMRDLDSAADFAAVNQDTGIIGNKTAENLFRVFLPGGMPGWLNGKEVNEKKLSDFLAAIRKMADTAAPVLEPPERRQPANGDVVIRKGGPEYDVGESRPEDVFNFAYGRIKSYVMKMSSFRALMLPNAAAERRGDCVALPLPGFVDNVFIPSAIVGINAKAAHQDIARDFLKTMLSKDIQSVKLGDGFAVNVSALSDTMELENNFFAMAMNAGFEGETLQAGVPGLEAQQKIFDLCLAVKTPYLVDDTLAEMVAGEAKGYFNGEKDLERTIADIRERTRIYLAE
jgi:ABC-type glycerol-3-phosphate transport system substrate-binding protein